MVGQRRLRRFNCLRISTTANREEGIVDGPSEWAFSLLQISRKIGSAQKVIRERVSPTGIGPGYVCDGAGNTGYPRI